MALLNGHGSGPAPGRAALPDRNVAAETIEDAYVAFIFHCNPALPADCDTVTLREAFRNPPRSGGKIFEPFTIYELVRRFYSKEIKTWTELTVKLGVEPPDPSKEESVQKIAQYGVRLKKWLHSMHVKAFFEYLMDMPNDYWVNIPVDPNPVATPVRDGIAVEDDMALRALLPHIRPKRGRKRPDNDNASNGPNQRQRTSPAPAVDEYAPQSAWPHGAHPRSTPMDAAPMSAVGGWPPHETMQTPLTRWPASAVTPSVRDAFWADEPRSAVTPSKAKGPHQRRGAKNVSSAWKLGGEDMPKKTRGRPPINRTPIDTPSTAGTAWPHTPNALQSQDKPDLDGHMGGQLSRNSSMSATPPVTMQDMSQPNMAFNHPQQPQYSSHSLPQNQQDGSRSAPSYPSHSIPQSQQDGSRPAPYPPHSIPENQQDGSRPAPYPSHSIPQNQQDGHRPAPYSSHSIPQNQQDGSRPARPSISLQVPQRPSGSVRLATPPPPQPQVQHPQAMPAQEQSYKEPLPIYDNMHAPPPGQPFAVEKDGDKYKKWEPINASENVGIALGETPGNSIPEYFFETMSDRTNIDGVMAYFVRMTYESQWYDEDGKSTQCSSMEEATAIINATLENMYKTAASSQAFLINLAALAGARMLMTNLTRCTRQGEKDGHTTYKCEWEYQFGHLHGYFNMAASVPFSMWRLKPSARGGGGGGEGSHGNGADGAGRDEDGPNTSDPQLQAEHWQNKYKALLDEADKKDRELFDLRNKVIDSLKTQRATMPPCNGDKKM
ncbi:ARS binding [Cordyceps militaris]|uniref:ARS binding n=1 Tax=Cordyceps militaris TaxID=73501 RepID=A0A2H4SN67_CORMI|nr:ARS binding [Cordyceps militaris]